MSKFYQLYSNISIIFCALFIFAFSYTFHSQSIQNNNRGTVFNKCGFEFKRNLFLSHAANNTKALQQEKDIKKYSTNCQPKSNDIYKIPVVVHVLHLGEAVGTGTNISDAQIQSSIDHLNQFYRGQTANSPVDFKIEFSLAKQDPNCNTTTGINRINASGVPGYSNGGVDYYGDGGEADENTLKDLSRWSETDYFNIWIISEIENNNAGSGIQGYANFYAGNAYEGSMMMYNVFGYDPSDQQPYSLKGNRDNSTVSHEFGHYLHLHHTFKGDGDANNDYIGDACPLDQTVGVDSDGCADTEPHKRYTSQCKSGQINDCTGATFNDNSAKNIMSYSSCQDRLTNDQKTRARAMLSTSGISLIYSNGDENPVSTSGSLSSGVCVPQHYLTSPGSAGIMNFTITDEFSHSSSYTANDGGYVDLTSECLKVIQLDENTVYDFVVSTWFNPHNIKGYIDYNNDGDFTDAGEEIFNLNTPYGTQSNPTTSVNTSVTIPTSNGSSVISNTPLRLRLNADLSSVSGPCHAPTHGQVEDYLLIINQAAGPCSATYSTDIQTACDTYTWIDGNMYTSSVNPTLNTNHNVQTQGMTFTPYTININVGDTVTFYNTGGYHNVNGSLATFPNNPEGFYSGNPSSSNWTFTHVFTLPGTYDYRCDPHSSSMAGVINVTSLNNITHTINNSQGCDSIITLNLTINSSPIVSIGNDTTICDNASITLDAGIGYSSYLWSTGSTVQTINVNSSGTYSVTITDNNNCSDSSNITISTTNCNPNCDAPTNLNASNVTTNAADLSWVAGGTETVWELTWGPQGFATGTGNLVPMLTSNSYNLTGLSANTSYDFYVKADCGFGTGSTNLSSWAGPYNFYTLPTSCSTTYSTDTQIACDSYTWIDGNTYDSSNNFATFTLINSNGCDSIVTLNLTINNSTISNDIHSSCNSFTWIDGNTYSASNNTATFTLTNSNGCDSIINLDLTIHNNYSDTVFVTICDTYQWNNNAYNQSGNYVDSNQTIYGCDSLKYLNLNINNSYNDTINITVCDSFQWNNNIYTSSGLYSNNYSSINNCDSLVTIELSVNNNIISPLNLELTLDWYCLETYWIIKDSQDSLWYNEGPYNCNPNGGGSQANDTIFANINLVPNECYTFELHDQYGDGMSANNYDTSLTNGNWILKDDNGNIMLQGSGNFGNIISTEFYVDSAILSSTEKINNNVSFLKAQPNPFKESTLITIKNTTGPFEIEMFDINGRIIYHNKEINNKFYIKNKNISKGIYWLRIKNQPKLIPLKLVIE